jgi:hypothetical protein
VSCGRDDCGGASKPSAAGGGLALLALLTLMHRCRAKWLLVPTIGVSPFPVSGSRYQRLLQLIGRCATLASVADGVVTARTSPQAADQKQLPAAGRAERDSCLDLWLISCRVGGATAWRSHRGPLSGKPSREERLPNAMYGCIVYAEGMLGSSDVGNWAAD